MSLLKEYEAFNSIIDIYEKEVGKPFDKEMTKMYTEELDIDSQFTEDQEDSFFETEADLIPDEDIEPIEETVGIPSGSAIGDAVSTRSGIGNPDGTVDEDDIDVAEQGTSTNDSSKTNTNAPGTAIGTTPSDAKNAVPGIMTEENINEMKILVQGYKSLLTEAVEQLTKEHIQALQEELEDYINEGWKGGALGTAIGAATPVPGGAFVGGLIGDTLGGNEEEEEETNEGALGLDSILYKSYIDKFVKEIKNKWDTSGYSDYSDCPTDGIEGFSDEVFEKFYNTFPELYDDDGDIKDGRLYDNIENYIFNLPSEKLPICLQEETNEGIIADIAQNTIKAGKDIVGKAYDDRTASPKENKAFANEEFLVEDFIVNTFEEDFAFEEDEDYLEFLTGLRQRYQNTKSKKLDQKIGLEKSKQANAVKQAELDKVKAGSPPSFGDKLKNKLGSKITGSKSASQTEIPKKGFDSKKAMDVAKNVMKGFESKEAEVKAEAKMLAEQLLKKK